MLSNADYPVAYYATPTIERNRLTVFFRFFLVIPHLLYLSVLSIALFFTIVISWFALVFTTRYPSGLYDFNAGFLRLATRVSAYAALQTDKYPGWGVGDDPDYPVVLRIGPRQESYSRWKVFLRYFLAIPFSLVAYAYMIVTFVFSIATWFMVVFTGSTSPGFHKLLNWGLAANARISAYGTFLLTDEWPPFEPDSGTPAAGRACDAVAEQSRSTLNVTVIGAGVVGLTCAHALREAGYDVHIIARDEAIVSEVAGGLWFPFATSEDQRVAGWALQTLEWLEANGHLTVDYLHLELEEPWWLAALPRERVREAGAAELPRGYTSGWVVRVPLVQMPTHLADLTVNAIERRNVGSLDELDGIVVNCAGLAARELTDDPTLVAARGQIAHVRTPPDVRAVCDEASLTYVLPRGDTCIVGGTFELGEEDVGINPEQTRAMLERARRLVPGLAESQLLGEAVGLRPYRPGGPRVERVGDVIHCYGHGGSGLTLSYGTARTVVDLVAEG